MAFDGLCYIYKVASEYKYLQEGCSTNIHLFKGTKKNALLLFLLLLNILSQIHCSPSIVKVCWRVLDIRVMLLLLTLLVLKYPA